MLNSVSKSSMSLFSGSCLTWEPEEGSSSAPFLAGFLSYLARHNTGELPALVYADVVAHLSTSQLGTIDVVTAEAADKEYKNLKTSEKEEEDTLYVHRTIDNV